jgi:NAD(P)-dependent dehydrogenase (short-subunit alcohol dehydrogenase family)
MSTWIITGAATGLGRLLAEHVLAEGHHVAAAALDVGPLRDLAGRYPLAARAAAMDKCGGR